MFEGSIALSIIALALYCGFDVLLSRPAGIRSLSRSAWLLLVVLVPVFGGLAWLLTGRPLDAGPLPGSVKPQVAPIVERTSGRPAPRGPEDDPAFIRMLQEQLRRPEND